jgi:HEAT repeat protein
VTVDTAACSEGRLRDADPQVQVQAARALGVIGNRAATAALLQRADEGGDPSGAGGASVSRWPSSGHRRGAAY